MVSSHGTTVFETDASKSKGNKAELIPAWMFELAWDHLRAHSSLTNRYLLDTNGLNVKRSSGVMAILAKLPGVTAAISGEGIALSYQA